MKLGKGEHIFENEEYGLFTFQHLITGIQSDMISPSMVFSLLSKLDTTKSVSPDGFSGNFLISDGCRFKAA